VLETAPMNRAAREELSLIVCDRAPWSVKCSVVSAVKSSPSRESATRRKLGEWPDGHRRDSIEIGPVDPLRLGHGHHKRASGAAASTPGRPHA
jgi:hypothetical protein